MYCSILNKYTRCSLSLYNFFLGNSGEQTSHFGPWLHSFDAQIFPSSGSKCNYCFPSWSRYSFFFGEPRVAAKVMHNVTHFRNQPGLCNATLPPPNNLGLCHPGKKNQAWKLEERRLKRSSSMVFNCALEFLIWLMVLPAHPV